MKKIIFILIFLSSQLFAQDWRQFNIDLNTPFFYDYNVLHSKIFILGESLTILENNRYTEYEFDSLSNGNIKKFIKSKKSHCIQFKRIFVSGKLVFLTDIYSNYFTVINGQNVKTFKFDYYEKDLLVNYFSEDGIGNLYFLTRQKVKNNYFVLYKISNSGISEVESNLPILKNNSDIIGFFTNVNSMFYIVKEKEQGIISYNLEIYSKSSEVNSFNIYEGKYDVNNKFYKDRKKIYIMNSEGELFILKNNNLENKISSSFTTGFSCFSYAVRKNYIYWANQDEIYISKIDNSELVILDKLKKPVINTFNGKFIWNSGLLYISSAKNNDPNLGCLNFPSFLTIFKKIK